MALIKPVFSSILLDLINFMTILIFITLLFLYNWLLIKLLTVKKQLFLFKITSKTRIFSHVLFLLFILCYIYYILKLRFLRVGFSFNIFEGVTMLQDNIKIIYQAYDLSYTTTYLMLYPILLIILGLSIVVFWTLLVPNVTNILRQSIIALYLYLLHFERFKILNSSLFAFLIETKMFVLYRVPNSYPNLLVTLNFYWRYLPVKLEYLIYRSIIPYTIIFDIITNFGNISTIFYVMPWFYIYTILRSFNIFIMKLIQDLEYREISYNMYGK